MKKIVMCGLFTCFCASSIYAMEQSKKDNVQILRTLVEDAKRIFVQKKSFPMLIGIAGCSAVGKSFFAEEFAELLRQKKLRTAILHCDDFLDPDYYDKDNFHPYFQHERAHAFLQRILSGELLVEKPRWNPLDQRPPAKVMEYFSLIGVQSVLFEGEFATSDVEPYNFRKYVDLSVFVDAKDDHILRWNWSRAREVKEKTEAEFFANNRPYLQKYRAFVSASRAADYVVSKDANHRYTLKKS